MDPLSSLIRSTRNLLLNYFGKCPKCGRKLVPCSEHEQVASCCPFCNMDEMIQTIKRELSTGDYAKTAVSNRECYDMDIGSERSNERSIPMAKKKKKKKSKKKSRSKC